MRGSRSPYAFLVKPDFFFWETRFNFFIYYFFPIPRQFLSARESVFATKLTWQVYEDLIQTCFVNYTASFA